MLSKIFGNPLVWKLCKVLILSLLTQAAKLSETDVDDKLVEDVKKALK